MSSWYEHCLKCGRRLEVKISRIWSHFNPPAVDVGLRLRAKVAGKVRPAGVSAGVSAGVFCVFSGFVLSGFFTDFLGAALGAFGVFPFNSSFFSSSPCPCNSSFFSSSPFNSSFFSSSPFPSPLALSSFDCSAFRRRLGFGGSDASAAPLLAFLLPLPRPLPLPFPLPFPFPLASSDSSLFFCLTPSCSLRVT